MTPTSEQSSILQATTEGRGQSPTSSLGKTTMLKLEALAAEAEASMNAEADKEYPDQDVVGQYRERAETYREAARLLRVES